MKLMRLVLLSVILLSLPSFVFGQSWWSKQFADDTGVNFNPTGASTRARGMGNAYLALSDDVTGATWNPAGAAFLTESEAAVEFLSNATTFDNEERSSGLNTYKYNTKNNIFSSFGYISPIRFYHRDFAIGINYYRVYDLSKDYDIFVPGRQEEYYMKFGVDVLKFTAATQIIPNISFGFNGNVYIRGFTEDFIQKEPVQHWIIGNDTTAVTWHLRNKVTYSGINFDFGLQGRFEGLSLGAVVTTPYKLKQESTTLAAQVVPDYGEQGWYIDTDIKTEIPIGMGAGIAYNFSQFTISADIWVQKFSESRYTMHPFWSQPTYIFIESFYPDTTYEEVNPYWQDITQYRFGAEYLMDLGNLTIPIRAGYRNDPKTYSDAELVYIDAYNQPLMLYPKGNTVQIGANTYETDYLDQVEGYIISLGTGIHYKTYKLDIAYEYGSAEQELTKNIIDTRWDSDNDQFVFRSNTVRNEVVKEKASKLYIAVAMQF